MIELTRRKVVREEIESSIEIILEEGSAVASHVLAWAAVDVLRGVAAARQEQTFLELLEAMVRPEMLKTWRALLRQNYNFSKHADIDPDKVIEGFDPELTNMTLLAAIEDYGRTYQQLTIPMYLFRGWLLAKSPHLLKEGAREDLIPHADQIFGKAASFSAVQSLYRELKRDRNQYLAFIPKDRLKNIEL
ncbi:hypothetical protein G7077_05510 [Sphingomonas piscis]|uniref:Uncharacterized protein n=1 Tax=Sphingomonas piscis TaxID=2714943 RepID=A0A6G7YNW9_9SPHN|nr:hypothetical protein [Sphingomonas piscis]QIK78440.1 hypothetical protein G7077_05510 [Sphingomonas piscis]